MSSPTPNDLTRQQLDELDALLQRMLSLPLTGPNEPTPVPFTPPPLPEVPSMASGSWRADPIPKTTRTPHLAEVTTRAPSLVSAAVLEEPDIATVDDAPEEYASPTPTWDPDPVARRASSQSPLSETAKLSQTVITPPEPVETPGTLRGVDAPAVPFGFRSPFADETPPPVPSPADEPVFAPPPIELANEAPSNSPSVPFLLWPLFAVNWCLEAVLSLFGPGGTAFTRPVPKHLLGALGLLLLAAAGVWTAQGLGRITIPWLR